MLHLTFFDSNNPVILWSLSLVLPKASASAFNCFQICKKNAREFKLLAILYFYRVIIIFKLTCNKCFLLLCWTKLEILVHICLVSLFNRPSGFTIQSSNRPSSSALCIFFFLGDFTNRKHNITIFYYIVKKQ